LIARDRIHPKKILAVTFTRAAAGETRLRLEKLGIKPDQLPDVRTLHSKAVGLLRRYHSRLDVSPVVRPLSDSEASLVMKDVAADLAASGIKLSFKGGNTIKDYLRAYRCEQSGAGVPAWVSASRQYMATYLQFSKVYGDLQGFYKSIDWFRVVNLAVHLLDSHADVLEKEQTTIEHLLVDEYQDLNRKDQELVRKLLADPRGLCIVGDEDQSIYESQRFADPTGLVNFHKTVAATKTLPLTVCHRCPTEILKKANALISNNKIRMKDKAPLCAADLKKVGTVATIWRRSKKAEIEWLVGKISELHGKGYEFRDFLVLFTEGQIAQDYIAALQEKKIPLDVKLKLVGPFDSPCFSMVLATLRFVAEQADNLALRQCLDYWPNIGSETIKQLRSLCSQAGTPLWQSVGAVAGNLDAHRSMARRRSVQEFHNVMSKLLGIRAFVKLVPAILTPLADCADDPGVRILAEYFGKQKGKESAMTVAEVLENFEQERESGKFDAAEEELPDKVRVMTMHSAKGLEAKVVFVPALEDDLVPGQMGNLEERRRLFFVSITRAKQLLLLSWASQRVGREIHREGGRMLGKKRSRFLTEMGE